MVGRITAVTPESMELIMVTQTTVMSTMAVVFFPGACNCSMSMALAGGWIGCPSSTRPNVRSILVCTLGGWVTLSGVWGKSTSSIDVAVRDMVTVDGLLTEKDKGEEQRRGIRPLFVLDYK
jgi:hypothetical protein